MQVVKKHLKYIIMYVNILMWRLKMEEKTKCQKSLKPLRLYTHTHTHTVYCLLENKSNIKIEEYINKDRTMIFFYIMGLSLCVLRYRAGPIGNTI